ncbi:MAG: PfkB family carbohydrate kinase [Sterolibacterium sp.]|jgi:hydroxyethylthiazole kinase-like sugar kinase family protein
MKAKTIAVIGGAYGEECAYPARQVFRGSGGRAAAILASLGAQVSLTTALGDDLLPTFASIAQKLGYSLDAKPRSSDIWFRYRHPLAHPTIYPHSAPTTSYDLPVVADNVLVFGMIEGRPSVHAKRAVYDPQDGIAATSFGKNGSTADDLALVMSFSEGKALTGETSPEVMANKLIREQSVSAVIIKCGPQGALVRTEEATNWIRAFPTKRVYKVGSGDVFSAAFAFSWLLEGNDALSSAWYASSAVAAYVETAQDRFDANQQMKFRAQARHALEALTDTKPRRIPDTQIYLAGPFFNTGQQWLIDEARSTLTDMGFKVFSPGHEIGIGPAQEVAPADLLALEQSGLVLALLDGFDPGTVFEIGYARARNIPVVAIVEAGDEPSLTMIIGSGCEVANDFATGIYAACWHLMGDV